MTYKIPLTSPKRVAAERFAAELRKAMAARKASTQRVAKAAGSSKAAVANWRAGGNLPRVDTAAKLAEVLDWPALVEVARAGRTQPCRRCGRPYVTQGGAPTTFCSVGCREIDEQLRRPTNGAALAAVVEVELARVEGTTRGVNRSPLRAALAAYKRSDAKRVTRIDKQAAEIDAAREAVAAMCGGCEPEGLCRTPECPLRSFSPLPLAYIGRAEGDLEPPEGAWGPANRDRTLAAIRVANAKRWSRPDAIATAAASNRARWAAYTPERRDGIVAKIRASRRQEAAS